jgi:hypothetical protein
LLIHNLKIKKMKKKHVHFIPSKDAELLSWSANYSAKIATLGASVGLTPAEITDQQDKAQVVIDAVNKVTQKTQEKEEAVTAKNLVRANELQELSNTAIVIKRHPQFTDNIGDELGIMGSNVPYQRSTLRSDIRATAYPGLVEIRFKKRGQTGGGVFSRLQGADNWELLGNTAVSPFVDNRPLAVAGKPEIREYIVRCWDGKDYIGQDSNIEAVVFAG